MKKTLVLLLLIGFTQLTLGQDFRIRIGRIEFFGIDGLDIGSIRASMSSVKDREVSAAEVNQVKATVRDAVRKVTGHSPTDVALVCCDDKGTATIYIGLTNKMGSGAFWYKPSPSGSVRLPDQAVRQYEATMQLEVEALQKNDTEDRSKGYSLSVYPPLRAKQLALREFAITHEVLLRRVVLRSAESKHRAIATDILGYARRSKSQISTLISASRDPSEGVRNNAVRALGVLVEAGAVTSKTIPAGLFIDMLNSGTWTDRNKASHLLAVLSKRRDPRLRHQLRLRALASLIEMARWRDPTHADDARMILGRVAGLTENQLVKLVADGEVEQIVSAAQHPR